MNTNENQPVANPDEKNIAVKSIPNNQETTIEIIWNSNVCLSW